VGIAWHVALHEGLQSTLPLRPLQWEPCWRLEAVLARTSGGSVLQDGVIMECLQDEATHSGAQHVFSAWLCACRAGVVQSAAELLDATQLETSVRCLMVLGMLLPSNPSAQQQLASNSAALQQLLQLLKQQEDLDAKLVARDLIRLLMQDEQLKALVEAAIREAAAG
jgi:hypothetical protein